VVIGAPFLPGTSSVPGAVYIVLSDGSMLGTPQKAPGPSTDGSNFGAAVAAGGDVNGDGYTDFVGGAFPTNSIWIDRGPDSGVDMPATITGPVSASEYGYSVAE
jgi:hypothetical protein